MNLIIHDLEEDLFRKNYSEISNDVVITDNGKIRNCIGCFGCWVKTPGVCIIKDGYENMGKLLSQTNKLIIISECFYGTYSPFVKNIWDRSISYLLPYFEKRNGETHHKPRYETQFELIVNLYGNNITNDEKKNAIELVKANGINFNVTRSSVHFYDSYQLALKEIKI